MYTIMYWHCPRPGVRLACSVSCNTGVWHCHGLTSLPNIDHQPLLISRCQIIIVTFTQWLETFPNTPHTEQGWLRRHITIFTTSKIQRDVQVSGKGESWFCCTALYKDVNTLIYKHQTQRQPWFVDNASWPWMLHLVSDVTIMQYCHIGSDASTSQPTRINDKDNQGFL